MSTTSQPPAPSKWAMEAAKELWDYTSFEGVMLGREHHTDAFAAIIQRHHAAAQAETVALLEAVVATELSGLKVNDIGGKNWFDVRDAHLAQLKEGAL